MQTIQQLVFLSITSLFMLAACGSLPAEPTATTSPAVAATEVVAPPTNTPSPEPTEAMADNPATSEPTTAIPTVTPTVETMVEEPTAAVVEPEPTEEMIETTTEPTPEEIDWLAVEGKTENDLAYRGNPEAPVTIIDYSDFL